MSLEQIDRRAPVHVGDTRPHLRLPTQPAYLDICLEEISPGSCVFTTWVGGASRSPESLINGGPCATLADFAMAAAVQSTLEPGAGYTIERFTVDGKRADTSFRGLLQARGEARDEGSGTTSATARVVDARGVLRCEARMVVRRRPDAGVAHRHRYPVPTPNLEEQS